MVNGGYKKVVYGGQLMVNGGLIDGSTDGQWWWIDGQWVA